MIARTRRRRRRVVVLLGEWFAQCDLCNRARNSDDPSLKDWRIRFGEPPWPYKPPFRGHEVSCSTCRRGLAWRYGWYKVRSGWTRILPEHFADAEHLVGVDGG